MLRSHADSRPSASRESEERPKDAWPVNVTGRDDHAPGDCDCRRPTLPPAPKRPCTRTLPPEHDCCEEILQHLVGQSGMSTSREMPRLYKPKTSGKIKLANWCCDWPVHDVVGPLFILLYRRFKNNILPKNDFEKSLYTVFRRYTNDEHAVVEQAVQSYLGLSDAARCAFETRYDNWPDDEPLDLDFVTKTVVHEIIALGRYGIFSHVHDGPTVGYARPWEKQISPAGPDGATEVRQTAPWPWICEVNPGADNIKWFKNNDYVVPINLVMLDKTIDVQPHNFDLDCSDVAADPTNPTGFRVRCKDRILGGVTGPSPNTFKSLSCAAGEKYAYQNPFSGPPFRCLKVPVCVAGQGVALRGFNFTSLNCTVSLILPGNPTFAIPPINATTMGDPKADASVAARCGKVEDKLTFTIPRTVKDAAGNDQPVTPGRYELVVAVPNESNYAPTPGQAPPNFYSNTVLIDIVPPLDIPYQVWFDRGRCYRETSGWGDDEAWFQAFTATWGDNTSGDFDVKTIQICRNDDTESGDAIGNGAVSLFSNTLLPYGVVAIAIMGLEVDSEDAAQQRIYTFERAFGLFFEQFFTQISGSLAGGVFGTGVSTLIDAGVVTASLLAGGAALLIIPAIGAMWAEWAAADEIGLDLLVFDQVSLFQLTVPGLGNRPSQSNYLGTIDIVSYPKGSAQTGLYTAVYTEERQYYSSVEKSRYGIDIRVVQNPI